MRDPRTTNIEGLLVDIDGVLTVSWKAIDDTPAAFAELQARGVPIRLATNTTTRTRAEIAGLLGEAGFDVDVSDILTAPAATASYLRLHHPDDRCFVLSSGDVTGDLEGVTIVGDEEDADVVVLGGAGLVFTHEQLNHAFTLLLNGAAFVAMHRNLYWRTSRGLELDTGAYVAALESATGVEPIVIGKPAASFFEAGLEALDLPPARVAMVGDDIENDVLGGQAFGLTGILVRTGKYRPEAVASADGDPSIVIDTFAQLPDLLG